MPDDLTETKQREGRPGASLRWTIGMVAREFGMGDSTVSTRLTETGTIPGADGNYSTVDVCNALFGDLKGNLIREQTGKTAAERKRLERQNKTEERELLPTASALRIWSGVILEYRQRVLYSEIPQHTKNELLSALEEPKLDEYFATESKDSQESDSDGPEPA